MKDINHLPDEEKEHFTNCSCGEYVDMRNLDEVFAHQHSYKIPEINWTYAVRKGEPLAYASKGFRKYLN